MTSYHCETVDRLFHHDESQTFDESTFFRIRRICSSTQTNIACDTTTIVKLNDHRNHIATIIWIWREVTQFWSTQRIFADCTQSIENYHRDVDERKKKSVVCDVVVVVASSDDRDDYFFRCFETKSATSLHEMTNHVRRVRSRRDFASFESNVVVFVDRRETDSDWRISHHDSRIACQWSTESNRHRRNTFDSDCRALSQSFARFKKIASRAMFFCLHDRHVVVFRRIAVARCFAHHALRNVACKQWSNQFEISNDDRFSKNFRRRVFRHWWRKIDHNHRARMFFRCTQMKTKQRMHATWHLLRATKIHERTIDQKSSMFFLSWRFIFRRTRRHVRRMKSKFIQFIHCNHDYFQRRNELFFDASNHSCRRRRRFRQLRTKNRSCRSWWIACNLHDFVFYQMKNELGFDLRRRFRRSELRRYDEISACNCMFATTTDSLFERRKWNYLQRRSNFGVSICVQCMSFDFWIDVVVDNFFDQHQSHAIDEDGNRGDWWINQWFTWQRAANRRFHDSRSRNEIFRWICFLQNSNRCMKWCLHFMFFCIETTHRKTTRWLFAKSISKFYDSLSSICEIRISQLLLQLRIHAENLFSSKKNKKMSTIHVDVICKLCDENFRCKKFNVDSCFEWIAIWKRHLRLHAKTVSSMIETIQ